MRCAGYPSPGKNLRKELRPSRKMNCSLEMVCSLMLKNVKHDKISGTVCISVPLQISADFTPVSLQNFHVSHKVISNFGVITKRAVLFVIHLYRSFVDDTG